MIREKDLDFQIDFLNQLLSAMDENKIQETKMKYVDSYLIHLEKENEKKKLEQKWEQEKKEANAHAELIENVKFKFSNFCFFKLKLILD